MADIGDDNKLMQMVIVSRMREAAVGLVLTLLLLLLLGMCGVVLLLLLMADLQHRQAPLVNCVIAHAAASQRLTKSAICSGVTLPPFCILRLCK